MVAFSRLAVAVSAVAGSLASPVELVNKYEVTTASPDFVLRRDNDVSLARRQSVPSYHQDYTTGGTVNYTPSGSTFSVN